MNKEFPSEISIPSSCLYSLSTICYKLSIRLSKRQAFQWLFILTPYTWKLVDLVGRYVYDRLIYQHLFSHIALSSSLDSLILGLLILHISLMSILDMYKFSWIE